MGLPKFRTKISVEEYLKAEESSPVRHEYFNGEVFAMAGASDNHARIYGNSFVALSLHLRNSSCEPFTNDIKVRVTSTVFYDPDILVSCEENPESLYLRNNPILIIEIVSRSTERVDRREKCFYTSKFRASRNMSSTSIEWKSRFAGGGRAAAGSHICLTNWMISSSRPQ